MGLRDLEIRPGLVLPRRLLSVRFSRSGGPGGQHVNKVESKVDLRLDLTQAEAILGPRRAGWIRVRLAGRLDGDGNLQVVADPHRDQTRNLEAAMERMETLLRGAISVAKQRRTSRPTAASRQRRLETKRRRGQVKKLRSDQTD